MRKTKEHRYEEVYLALLAALNDKEILSRLSVHGYARKSLLQAKGQLEQLKALDVLHQDNLGKQQNTTRQINTARRELQKLYMRHVKIAREALADHYDHWDVLRLKGVRKKAFPEWIEQVKAFYNNYHRVEDMLSLYNITPDIVEQAQAMIEAISEQKISRSLSRSRAQQATHERIQASRELEQWMKDFFYIARFALRDKPQYLEAMGKVVRS